MLPVIDSEEYLARMLGLARPGAGKVLAFYEHRVGAICKDAKLLLLPMDDHLVHRGDGVFEALKFVGRRLYQLDAHIERMKGSSAAIGLEPPCSFEEIRAHVLDVCRASEAENGFVRILLGRGPGGFGVDPSECPAASLYIIACAFTPKPESLYERGASAFRTSIPAKQPWLAKIKSIDYLPNVLMKKEASALGADFPVCYDERGFMAEGATENLCIVDEAGRIEVPELTNALTGTTMVRAFALAEGEIPVVYKEIREEDIVRAREMIVLGTTNDALGIVSYNGKPVGDGRPGPVGRRLRELILADIISNGIEV